MQTLTFEWLQASIQPPVRGLAILAWVSGCAPLSPDGSSYQAAKNLHQICKERSYSKINKKIYGVRHIRRLHMLQGKDRNIISSNNHAVHWADRKGYDSVEFPIYNSFLISNKLIKFGKSINTQRRNFKKVIWGWRKPKALYQYTFIKTFKNINGIEFEKVRRMINDARSGEIIADEVTFTFVSGRWYQAKPCQIRPLFKVQEILIPTKEK